MKAILVALIATVSAFPEKFSEGPLRHPNTGLAITTTGYHWYGQEPLSGFVQLNADISNGAYPEKFNEGPLRHPDTGLAITTTGKHWYGQEPLAGFAKKQEGVRFLNDPVL
jgi:hypothetical protein